MPNSDEKDAVNRALEFFKENDCDPQAVLRKLLAEPTLPEGLWVFTRGGQMITVNAGVRYELVTSLVAALAFENPLMKTLN